MAYEFLHALIGGIMIGLAATLVMLSHGRVMGVSGIVARLLPPDIGSDWGWRLTFLAGVIAAPLLLVAFTGVPPAVSIEAGRPVLLLAGFFVGLGTVTGNGCTSGHGVCGLARFSRRSVVATGTFMGTAILTVFLVRLAGGS